MKFFYYLLFSFLFLSSCSTKNQIIYLKDLEKQKANSWSDFSSIKNKIEAGDILKIDVITVVPEASVAYNKRILSTFNNNIELLKLEGYLVDDQMMINFPVIGRVNVDNLNSN